MGGKTATSQQSVAIPPQVLAQYASVNSRATQTADTPFSTYGGEFVAPVNQAQDAGITATNNDANEAQPYYAAGTSTLASTQSGVDPVNQAATGLAAASAEQVDPSQINGSTINQYLSPYLGDVLGSTEALQNQSNQQAQAGQLGNAITSGAFGSDRTGIAAANLQQQEDLANSSVISGIANTGFNTALSTAQQQQGVGLSAAQANRTALGTAAQTLSGVGSTTYGEGANTASELGTLGTGAQTAGLSGAQAQIAAGTVEQQTQQAQDTAQYNQFLQQQSYPFQVDQFLANIAEGTGALSGSTTTTQQPGGFFSDERLKEDMEPVGKTFDGQTIYRYKIKGDSRDRIGLSAQKVEKKHPDAVGVAGGFRYVDYGKATEEAANRGHFYAGGVVPMRRTYAMGGSPDGSGLGAVLQAQQQMYGGGPNSQQQRNISGVAPASHQLAVASGSPAPAPSGSSKVSQTVGLGKDAYQGYKYLTKPSATPSGTSAPAGGATPANNYSVGIDPNATYVAPPDYSEGLTGDWQASAAPGGQASGVAGADATAAPAAGDAAASGAADVAGTGAADAAGAGAAEAGAGVAAGAGAGAAAGAAGTAAGAGAADAAAAIAAEYAAADVAAAAAAAAMAAKRGGAIRGKFDAGGSPYSADGDQIDIPDEQTSAKVQQAGPLVKQPTGLQTAMKMGNPDDASSIAGSMFSNEALASGGVAGRRGYDDGGAPSDDETPDVASYGPGVMDADSAPSGGAAGSSDEPSLWDKVKKHATAENVVPILTGLAAMGTAKTRSPGVALAAGLGAGSQSYLDTRKSLADTANEQARTQGLDIANQLATMKNQAAKSYLSPSPSAVPVSPYGTATAAPAAAPNGPQSSAVLPAAGAMAAQKIDDTYRNRFYVPPVTADEAAKMKQARGAAIALGSDQPVQDVQWSIDKRVAGETAANRNVAQAEADRLYGVATDPTVAPPDKQAALAKYNAVHQWTGDEYLDQGGVTRNKRTGAPAIGVAATQLSPSSWVSMMNEANRLVDVPLSNGQTSQTPNWQVHGATSPEDYARQLTSAAPPPPSSVATASTPPANTRPRVASTPKAAVAPPTAGLNNPPQSPVAPAGTVANPYLEKALADPRYQLATPPVQRGITPSPAQLDQQKTTVASRTQLLKDSQDATKAASNSLQYLQAAKTIMESKGKPVTGIFGPAAHEVSRVFNGVNATNYQEVAKYLGNAAVQSGRANFPNATQSEVGLQLNELSPSVKMTDDAINELLTTNIRSSKYTLDSANRVNDYLEGGHGDPQKFDSWNQQWYPREKLINQPEAPPVGTVKGGYKFNGGDPADKSNWAKVRQ